jgi:hypothetical protein
MILDQELECTKLVKITLRELVNEMGGDHAIALMTLNEMANDPSQPDDVIRETEYGSRFIDRARVENFLGRNLSKSIAWLIRYKLIQVLSYTSEPVGQEYIKVNCHEIRMIFIGS